MDGAAFAVSLVRAPLACRLVEVGNAGLCQANRDGMRNGVRMPLLRIFLHRHQTAAKSASAACPIHSKSSTYITGTKVGAENEGRPRNRTRGIGASGGACRSSIVQCNAEAIRLI
jgi:hypothetical protein